MNIYTEWNTIVNHFNASFKTNLHVTIAFIDSENKPGVTPIGTLFLSREKFSGVYFERYPKKLRTQASKTKEVCVLCVNSGIWFRCTSLFRDRFQKHPAIKLYGTFGSRREASAIEIKRLQKRMKVTNWTKGNKSLWGDMEIVREINFYKAEKMKLGKMMNKL